MGMREAMMPTRDDALGEIQLRLSSRPMPEVVAAIDRYAELVPELTTKVWDKAVAGDRPGAVMELRFAIDERPR